MKYVLLYVHQAHARLVDAKLHFYSQLDLKICIPRFINILYLEGLKKTEPKPSPDIGKTERLKRPKIKGLWPAYRVVMFLRISPCPNRHVL